MGALLKITDALRQKHPNLHKRWISSARAILHFLKKWVFLLQKSDS